MQKTSALIGEGKSLSQCFSLFPSVFPPYQLSLLEAGEASGRMEEVLECIARKIEREEETRGKVREAVAYPAFIAFFGLATVLILLIWIVPRIASVYDDFGEPLPGFTRWVIGLSRGMKFLVPGLLLAMAVSLPVIGKLSRRLGPSLMKAPLFGTLWRSSELGRKTHLLSLLLRSGVPLLRALEAAGERAAGQRVARGETLSEAFGEIPFINASALALIQAGEESGALAECLEEISRASARDLETAARMILKLLEPALILAVGTVTGFVAVAMILPIMSLSSVAR